MVCDPSHRCCSSLLQEDCIPLAWPSQTLYYARLRDNFIQMCKYARDHTMSLSWNALMTTTSQTPPVQLNQQNFAAWTPPRGQHATPFPWQRRGRQNLCYIATSYLLTFYIYTPPPPTTTTIAGLEHKWKERGWDFSSQLAGSSRFHLTQLPLTEDPF